MDEELKTLLAGFEQRLSDRFDGVERRLDGLQKEMSAVEERANQRTEKVETNLLTAFHGWARAMEIRSRGTSTVVAGFDERLSYLEDRVSELERRKAN